MEHITCQLTAMASTYDFILLLAKQCMGMSSIDWMIMIATLASILIYGVWKGRHQVGTDSYMLANRDKPWYTVLIGIMATQASAITFISGPGQSYNDGMRFLQYYFGLPLAMIVISLVFIPIFQRLQVATAYEYLDKRFDRKTRIFSGILFLFSRGVSTGMSVYAPAIVISAIFGWDIYISIIVIGGLLLTYTMVGGAQSIAATQQIQFTIIISCMIIAGVILVFKLPDTVTFGDALSLGADAGKMNIITTQFAWNDKYNLWSGLIGGFFLSLSYFGTDQSQVGRYLSAKDVRQARLGILMNGFVKIPMQFGILLIGVLLFVFFSWERSPVTYNDASYQYLHSHHPEFITSVTAQHDSLVNKRVALLQMNHSGHRDASFKQQLLTLNDEIEQNQDRIGAYVELHKLPLPKEDTNFVFLYFVKRYLPIGLVGLVFAIIFLASWGSIAAALNALASSSLIDIQQLISKNSMTPSQELWYGRFHTLLWGLFSIGTAFFATKMGSLIEAVNVLGSLFYGPMLGIFLAAFYMKRVGGTAVFYGAIIAELVVLIFYKMDWVGFLWLNVIGSVVVLLVAGMLSLFYDKKSTDI